MTRDIRISVWSIWTVLLVLATPFSSGVAFGKNVGVVGPVYPIGEEDAIEAMKREAAKLDPEVVKKKLLEDVRRQGMANLDIPHTEVASDRRIEPQAVFSDDIKDAEGKIIAKKGTVFNPLEKSISRRIYLILDGTDPKEVKWLSRKLTSLKDLPVKILVTKGNVFELSQEWKKMVYPATKEIVNALYVKTVPTQVTQEGKILHVEAEVQ